MNSTRQQTSSGTYVTLGILLDGFASDTIVVAVRPGELDARDDEEGGEDVHLGRREFSPEVADRGSRRLSTLPGVDRGKGACQCSLTRANFGRQVGWPINCTQSGLTSTTWRADLIAARQILDWLTAGTLRAQTDVYQPTRNLEAWRVGKRAHRLSAQAGPTPLFTDSARRCKYEKS